MSIGSTRHTYRPRLRKEADSIRTYTPLEGGSLQVAYRLILRTDAKSLKRPPVLTAPPSHAQPAGFKSKSRQGSAKRVAAGESIGPVACWPALEEPARWPAGRPEKRSLPGLRPGAGARFSGPSRFHRPPPEKKRSRLAPALRTGVKTTSESYLAPITVALQIQRNMAIVPQSTKTPPTESRGPAFLDVLKIKSGFVG